MPRSLLYLLVTLGVAIGIYYVERPDQPRVASQRTRLLPQLTIDRIARLEIEQLTEGVALVRTGDTWVARTFTPALKTKVEQAAAQAQGTAEPAMATPAVPVDGTENLPVDPTLLNEALAMLTQLTVGSPVSRNPDSQAKLQVGPLGLQVRAHDAEGKELAKVWIGKTGPDYFSSYIRVGEANEVYLVEAQLRGQFPVQVKSWRNKQLWSIDPDTELQKVEWTVGNGASVVLSKNTAGRLVMEGADAVVFDAEPLQTWLAGWVKLKAVEFPEQVDMRETGLEKPVGRFKVTLKNGTTKTLLIGRSSPSGLPYGVLAGEGPVALLPSTILAALNADWHEWAAKSATAGESHAP